MPQPATPNSSPRIIPAVVSTLFANDGVAHADDLAHARLDGTLDDDRWGGPYVDPEDDHSGLLAWIDDDGRFFAVGGDDVVREYGDGPEEAARLDADMQRDGRGHDPLRIGAHPPAGDRRTGDAGALPEGQDLRAGEPLDLAFYPVVGDEARLPVDPAGRHRPLRSDAGAGLRGLYRPVLLAAPTSSGDLQARVGRWRARGGDLPLKLQPLKPEHPDFSFLEGLSLATGVSLFGLIIIGIIAAAVAGRL